MLDNKLQQTSFLEQFLNQLVIISSLCPEASTSISISTTIGMQNKFDSNNKHFNIHSSQHNATIKIATLVLNEIRRSNLHCKKKQ